MNQLDETEKPREGAPSPGLVFRYDRSRRLARASASVRWLEARRGARRPGLLTSLVATRSSRILLALIAGVALYFMAGPVLEERGAPTARLGGSTWSLDAAWDAGQLRLAVRRVGAEPPPGSTVHIGLSLPDGSSAQREFALAGGREEFFRFIVPLGGSRPERVALMLLMGGEGTTLSATPR